MLQRLRVKVNGMLVSGKQYLTTRLATTLREYAESKVSLQSLITKFTTRADSNKLAEQSEQLRLPKFGAHNSDGPPTFNFGHNEGTQQALHNALDVLKDALSAKTGSKVASGVSFRDVDQDHRGHMFEPEHALIFDRTISQALRQRSSLHDTQPYRQRISFDSRPQTDEQPTSAADLDNDNASLLSDSDAETQPEDDASLRQEVVKLRQKNVLLEVELLGSQQDLRLLRLHAIGLENRLALTQLSMASLRDQIQHISQAQEEMSKKLHTVVNQTEKVPAESQSKLAFVLSWKSRNRKGGI
ncbi:hypothetical protein E4T38_07975 [Aureobasidium subglaciale]|nr:hypothetical protein E4T38_07975 [Aureobasidium subglaciale]KAI5216449.1 hypothetical protein E4T40_07985 [Aureobasidium subglaciale]KAI5219635.1 hypothetical protein E4T41_07845 [Aureobasidium subglaciale]KAI5257641.1 hypothetical protein E4T46_07876 [Aureobasidium subglaciale]